MDLHIEFRKWEPAFLLAKSSQHLADKIKLPYAEDLCRRDRYEDALKVYKKLGR